MAMNKWLSLLAVFFFFVLSTQVLTPQAKQEEPLVNAQFGWPSGAFTDTTLRPNFHTSSNKRADQIGDTFTVLCGFSTESASARYEFRISNSTGWDSVVFPGWLMNPPKAIPTGTSTPTQIHRNVQVWASIESVQPVVVVGFTNNRTAISESRLLVPTGAAGYNPTDPANANAKTMFYNVQFKLMALRPGFYGTRAGIATREDDGTYSVRLTAKFSDKALSGSTLFTPLSTETSVVPLSQHRVYVRVMKSDASTRGEWVHVLRPLIQKYELPTYDNANPDYDAEREGPNQPAYATTTPSPATNGIISGAVDQYGYVNLVLKNLSANANYSCYISPVPANSNLEVLLANGVEDLDFIMPALTVLTQPMQPCLFRTPPSPNDVVGMTIPVKVAAMSCIEGHSEVLDGIAEGSYDVIFLNGDITYNDNQGKNRQDDTGNDEADFIANHDRLLRDDGMWKAFTSASLFCTESDHKVQDAWFDFIMFMAQNAAKFQYTTQEIAVLDAVAAVALNRAKTPIPKVAVTPNGVLVKNQRVIDATNALERAWPGFPYNGNHYSRNFAADRGQVKLIVPNSNPTIYSNGSIEYYKARALVNKGNEANPIFIDEPGTYIPNPAFEFLKSQLLSEKSRRKKGERRPPVTFVIFSDRISPVYGAEKIEKLVSTFVEMASVTAPSFSSAVAESAMRKTIYRARGATSDVFPEQYAELKAFIAREDLSNIFFITGDAHNSAITPIDEKRVVWEISSSTIGNYKANGIIYQFMGNPHEEPTGSVGVSENSYAHIESNAFPSDPHEEPHVDVKLMFGRRVQAHKKISLRAFKN